MNPHSDYTILLPLLKDEALRSNCDKIGYGAIILDQWGCIVSTGFNHSPVTWGDQFGGRFSCSKHCAGGIRKGVLSGTCLERCYAVHAEQAAIVSLKRSSQMGTLTMVVAGWLDEKTRLFDNSHGFYCTFCARLTIEAGIKNVVLFDGEGNPIVKTALECWTESYQQLRDEAPPTLREMIT